MDEPQHELPRTINFGPQTHFSVAVKGLPLEADFSFVVFGERREPGEASLTFRGKIRRDTKGRVRFDYQGDARSESAPDMAYIIDQDAGSMTVIASDSRTAYAYHSERPESAETPGWVYPGHPRQPAGALGWKEVEGARCRRQLLEVYNKGGPTRQAGEVWLAEDLAQVVYEKLITDTGEFEWRLSNIRRDEPDPSLFVAPPGFTVLAIGDK